MTILNTVKLAMEINPQSIQALFSAFSHLREEWEGSHREEVGLDNTGELSALFMGSLTFIRTEHHPGDTEAEARDSSGIHSTCLIQPRMRIQRCLLRYTILEAFYISCYLCLKTRETLSLVYMEGNRLVWDK